ncbi:Cna B-type domain-containing protein, partial [Bacillus cereus group sp. N28]|uniref:Cna B-type domain-containing protein n=1 Tax=Bacillus cereus group sp. N28 TaxID=2794593 RepID=UPI0027DEA514
MKSHDETGCERDSPNKPQATSVSGTNLWKDNNNKFGKRPESITVQLLQNGTAVSYTHLRAHETPEPLVCRHELEKK